MGRGIYKGERKNPMNILIAMNDAYVKYYQVVVTSLCRNNSESDIVIHIPYTSELSEEGLALITKTANDNNAKVKTYELNKDNIKAMSELPLGMWSVETFFRLFVQDIISDTEDRILWLDGDIIVNGDISDFYNVDFEGNYYAACEDIAISRGKMKQEYDNLGWDSSQIYVNAGVLLINLAQLRREKITQNDIVRFIEINHEKMHFLDQYTLNAMFHDRIKLVDGFKYNCQVSGYSYTKGRQILNESVILHFPGYRPWQTDYQKHYSSAIPGDIWWKYARMCGRGEGFLKWKILNTVKVKPWQAAYRLSKAIKSKKRK